MAAPAWDADNHACEAGACVYIGCHDDAECPASSRCADVGGAVRYCFDTCTMASDCPLSGPASDADNYACRDGLCFFLGCNDDAECAATSPSTPRCH